MLREMKIKTTQNRKTYILAFSNTSLGGKTVRKIQEVVTVRVKIVIHFGGEETGGWFLGAAAMLYFPHLGGGCMTDKCVVPL